MILQACETLPSCLASSNRPTFALMTFCSVVIVGSQFLRRSLQGSLALGLAPPTISKKTHHFVNACPIKSNLYSRHAPVAGTALRSIQGPRLERKLTQVPFAQLPAAMTPPKTVKVMRPINSAYSMRAAPRRSRHRHRAITCTIYTLFTKPPAPKL
jgi:hypothetical protein